VNNNNVQTRQDQGFTLVEIMIALMVFSAIMLGVAAGLIAAIRTNQGNVVRSEALRIAEDELNRLRGERFTTTSISADLAQNAPAWSAPINVLSNVRGAAITFARARQVTDLATAATALKRIEVAVGWNDSNNPGGAVLAATGMNRQVSLSTIIVRSD